jgi:predicted amino acid dehydrogenase
MSRFFLVRINALKTAIAARASSLLILSYSRVVKESRNSGVRLEQATESITGATGPALRGYVP